MRIKELTLGSKLTEGQGEIALLSNQDQVKAEAFKFYCLFLRLRVSDF